MSSVSTPQRFQRDWLAGARAPFVALFRPVAALPLQVLLPLLLLSVGVAGGVAWATVRFPAAVFAVAGVALVGVSATLFAPAISQRLTAGARSVRAVFAPAVRAPVVVEPVVIEPEPVGQTVIGPGLSFVGKLSGEGGALVLGRFTGEVRTTRLEIGPGGWVDGDIACDEVDISGRATGELRCGIVRVRDGGLVEGRIAHRGLEVEYGAVLDTEVGPLRRRPRRVAAKH